MEKILEFEKDHPSPLPSKYYRFQCDCLQPGDAMTLGVEGCGKDSEDKYFTIEMQFVGTSFWDRIKYAWQIVRGHWNWRDFVVRQDDAENIHELFDPNKKFSELP